MSFADRLIAHRGILRDRPENTLEAIDAAIASGARYVEIDVQLSADGVPVVIHDATLARSSGREVEVMTLPAAELLATSAHYPQRFGTRFEGVRIPSLAQVAGRVGDAPGVTLFVEIKRHSVERFGVMACVDAVGEVMSRAACPWVAISFLDAVVACARERLAAPIGWVARHHVSEERVRADALRPEWMFVDVEKIACDPRSFWPGPWRWVVYDVMDPRVARAWFAAGADCVETGAIDHMIPALGD